MPRDFVDKLYTACLQRALQACARSPFKDREQIVKAMTLPQVQTLSQRHLDSSKMVWLVVGDAKTQLARMKDLGFGEPVLIESKQRTKPRCAFCQEM